MDQLVVLQEIYGSFSKGGDGLQEISNKAIEGSCPDLMGKLFDSTRKGRIDEDACRELSLKLQDVYEIKRLGDICRKAGLHGLAISTYNRALSLRSDPLLRPVLQNNLGQAYASQGDLAKAVFYYGKAADCFAREGDHTGLAHVLGNLGSAYRRSGEWDKAVEHCYKSLKTFEEKGDDLGIAQMTGSLGRIYADMGEQELAARYFEKSLSDFQRLGDKRSAAWVQDRLGRIAGEKKDWDRALCYFHQALSLFQELGQESSQGLVLANIGSLYLQMGEADAAREPLERATLLISRQMKPHYQNSLYCLAKTYSTLAKNCLQEALNVEGAGDGENTKNGEEHSKDRPAGQLRLEASRLFARASDRYQELASTRSGGRNGIKVEAAMARCRSYLARLCGQVSDEEALSLAERALASLDIAAANAGDDGKAGILGLQRTISGMKEARCIGLLGNEPSMQARALTNAGEYLMGGASEWGSDEAGGFLCEALKSINAGIQARISGRDPAPELLAGAAALRQAKEHPRAAEIGGEESSARMIAGAAKILEEAAKGFAGEVREAETPSAGGKELSFQPEKEALLLMAGAMASDSLSRIEDSDSLNPMVGTEKVESPVQIDINHLRAEPKADPIARTDLPALEISEERCEAMDLILADGTLEASESAIEMANAGKGWLAPIKSDMACRSSCQLFLPPKRELSSLFAQTSLKSEEKFEESTSEPGEGTFDQDRNETPQEIGIEDRIEDEIDEEIEDSGQKFSESGPDPAGTAEDARKSPFSQSRAIFLLKALTVLTVMLLAIEAILYLI